MELYEQLSKVTCKCCGNSPWDVKNTDSGNGLSSGFGSRKGDEPVDAVPAVPAILLEEAPAAEFEEKEKQGLVGVERHKHVDWKAEARSVDRLISHKPFNIYCDICRRSKLTIRQSQIVGSTKFIR